MSNTSTYKRFVKYTLKDGTEKKRQYDLTYHRKKPMITLHQRNIMRRVIRKEILDIDDGKLLTKLKNFMETIKALDINEALILLDSTQAVISEEIKKIDDEDLPPQNSISNVAIARNLTGSAAITC